MAKPKPVQSDRTRGRLLYVEIDGGSEALANAFETLTAAIQLSAGHLREPRPPLITAARTAVAVADTAPSVDEDPQRTFNFSAPGDADSDETALPDSPRKKRGDGEKVDRNAGIELVGDIDFVPKGKQSLKELFAHKNPDSDLDQILVICYFLQHVVEVTSIGPGHILSGFKHVGKPVPKDLKQTIRNLKKQKAWLGFTKIDEIRLTTEGDNRVEHELGKPRGEVE